MIGNDEHQAYSLPFLSYPTKLDCLGLMPINPAAFIKEGFIVMSYDFQIEEAD